VGSFIWSVSEAEPVRRYTQRRWTLSNDEVWRTTHQAGGRLFFFGGTIRIHIAALVLSSSMSMTLLVIFRR
jgi:uncharacterized membrane protein